MSFERIALTFSKLDFPGCQSLNQNFHLHFTHWKETFNSVKENYRPDSILKLIFILFYMKCVFTNRLQPTLICFKRFQNIFEWFDENLRKHSNQRCSNYNCPSRILNFAIAPLS